MANVALETEWGQWEWTGTHFQSQGNAIVAKKIAVVFGDTQVVPLRVQLRKHAVVRVWARHMLRCRLLCRLFLSLYKPAGVSLTITQ